MRDGWDGGGTLACVYRTLLSALAVPVWPGMLLPKSRCYIKLRQTPAFYELEQGQVRAIARASEQLRARVCVVSTTHTQASEKLRARVCVVSCLAENQKRLRNGSGPQERDGRADAGAAVRQRLCEALARVLRRREERGTSSRAPAPAVRLAGGPVTAARIEHTGRLGTAAA